MLRHRELRAPLKENGSCQKPAFKFKGVMLDKSQARGLAIDSDTLLQGRLVDRKYRTNHFFDTTRGYIRQVKGFGPEYTGGNVAIGNDDWNREDPVSDLFNGFTCSKQISFAMVLSGHPLVSELLNEAGYLGENTFDPEPLRKAEVLQGMKILDMGCGKFPTFARVARKLGADVYTVDVIPSDLFFFVEENFSKEDRQLEASKHIQIDLNEPNSARVILNVSKGRFDLTTESYIHLAVFWEEFDDAVFRDGPNLAMDLLRVGGVHYSARDDEVQVKTP